MSLGGVFNALAQNTTVTELLLAGTLLLLGAVDVRAGEDLRENVGIAMAECLSQNSTLKLLSMTGKDQLPLWSHNTTVAECTFADAQTFAHLGQGLMNNQSIEQVFCAAQVARVFSTVVYPVRFVVVVHGCLCTPEAFSLFCEHWPKANRCLKELHLCHMGMTDQVIDNLAFVLRNHSTLESLSLEGAVDGQCCVCSTATKN